MHLPIYLDHAATTPVADAALAAMLPYFGEYYGNASSIYSLGAASREAVEEARGVIAGALNASPEEIVFTSGGTESDNAALRGAAEARLPGRTHLLCSAIEHHAVLETMESLAHSGRLELEILPVNREGLVDPDDIAKRIRPETSIVSVMHANNEIGVIQPIAEIGAICRERAVLFHTDAVQTAGKLPIDVRAMQIDLLSLSAHKLYGPKGAGALFIRRGVQITRYQDGGEQERGRRGGTINVPGVVGLGRSMELAIGEMAEETGRLSPLRDRLISSLQERIDGVHIMGSRTHRLAMNAHICIERVQGEPLLLALDTAGICASAGSACSAGSTDPSHVLKALGVGRDLARGAIRLTLGKSTTAEALEYTVDTLCTAVAELRRLGS